MVALHTCLKHYRFIAASICSCKCPNAVIIVEIIIYAIQFM